MWNGVERRVAVWRIANRRFISRFVAGASRLVGNVTFPGSVLSLMASEARCSVSVSPIDSLRVGHSCSLYAWEPVL
ncbi:hypothetical protein PAXRUDRAFT_829660 [Paxillus rubicundulus Ve08.2h10]|uniref:Uncharacterized protein n=1 Tax=Paxillus rubicundulus Ve08.2h10 TaxID=930991 RepID=A0A0D0E5I0_9AGAM|nr:hypothetical protein PAXRUDRAFT_829660 [Paxillus rubicundulus Ve08.2h10]